VRVDADDVTMSLYPKSASRRRDVHAAATRGALLQGGALRVGVERRLGFGVVGVDAVKAVRAGDQPLDLLMVLGRKLRLGSRWRAGRCSSCGRPLDRRTRIAAG